MGWEFDEKIMSVLGGESLMRKWWDLWDEGLTRNWVIEGMKFYQGNDKSFLGGEIWWENNEFFWGWEFNVRMVRVFKGWHYNEKKKSFLHNLMT